jgi:hypothetical protein
MPEQASAVFEQVMAQCTRGCFTGLLRIRTPEGNGEVRFLSGIQDGVRFESAEGDEALTRLLAASEPEFEVISSLPPMDLESTEPVAPEGRLERFHAAQLMRYCETNSLTCALELDVNGVILTARYRLGELLSVEPDSDQTARLAEAKQGSYKLRLPRFELPAHVLQRRASVPAPAEPAAPVKAAVPAATAPLMPAAKPAPVPAAVAQPKPAAVATSAAAPARGAPFASTRVEPVAPAVKAPPAAAVAPTAPAAAKATPAVTAPKLTEPAAAATTATTVTVPVKAAPAAASADVRPPVASGARVLPHRSIEALPGQPLPRPAAGPQAVSPQPVSPQVGAGPQPAAAELAAAVRAAPRPVSPAAVSPAAVSPAAVSPSSATSARPPLEGLWADAVSPPGQAAPLELDAESSSGARPRPGLSAAQPATGKRRDRAEKRSTRSPRYGLVIAMALMIAAIAGWFALGSPVP